MNVGSKYNRFQYLSVVDGNSANSAMAKYSVVAKPPNSATLEQDFVGGNSLISMNHNQRKVRRKLHFIFKSAPPKSTTALHFHVQVSFLSTALNLTL